MAVQAVVCICSHLSEVGAVSGSIINPVVDMIMGTRWRKDRVAAYTAYCRLNYSMNTGEVMAWVEWFCY